RAMAAVLSCKPVARVQQLIEELAQMTGVLKLAQVCRIGRGGVDRDVVTAGIDSLQAVAVVAGGFSHRCFLLLADVGADDTAESPLVQPLDQVIDALVVEAQAIDERAVLAQAEQARLRVARLRFRSGGANLDEAETQI